MKRSRVFILTRQTSSLANWRDGRIGELHALRPDRDYGALVFQENGFITSPPKAEDSYHPLVVEIVRFFEAKKPPA